MLASTDDGLTVLEDTRTRVSFVFDAPLDGDVVDELRRLMLLADSPSQIIRDRQILARAVNLLDHGVANVPFYRRAATTYDPARIASLEDFARLPPLRKRDLRANMPGGLVDDSVDVAASVARGELGFVMTSGTGEERTSTLLDLDQPLLPFDVSALWEVPPEAVPSRLAVLTTPLCTGNLCHASGASYEDRLDGPDCLYLTSTSDLFGIGDRQVRAIASEWERFEPDLLMVNPHYLHWVGRRMEALGLPRPRVGRVLSSYQYLSRIQRRAIEAIFGTEVRDFYAATDAGRMAVECVNGRMHMRDDLSLLDAVPAPADARLPAGVGPVAVTTLGNAVAPLVRYLVGDLARTGLDRCSCAFAEWPCIELHGRWRDCLVTADGVRTTRQVDDAIAEVPGIDFYQAVQDGSGAVDLRVIPEPGGAFDPARASRVLDALGVETVTVRTVRRLEAEPSRKLALVKTCLPIPGYSL
ncbi:MAG: hypothetical protein U0Q55_22765 [Vicinamibacterales bacterium]